MLTEKHELPKLPGAAKWKAKIDPTFVPKAPERRRQPPTHPTDSNDAALEVMRGDRLLIRHHALPIATLVALRGLMDYTTDTQSMARITTPFLISQSFDDASTHAGGAKMVHAVARTPEEHKFLDLYRGAAHNLLANMRGDPHMFPSWCDFIEGALSGAFVN